MRPPSRPPVHPLRAALSMFAHVGFFATLFFGLFFTLFLAKFGVRLAGATRGTAVVLALILLPSSALAALAGYGAFHLHRERNRRLNNQCPRCGYDLAMSPHYCPECGLVVRRRRRV